MALRHQLRDERHATALRWLRLPLVDTDKRPVMGFPASANPTGLGTVLAGLLLRSGARSRGLRKYSTFGVTTPAPTA